MRKGIIAATRLVTRIRRHAAIIGCAVGLAHSTVAHSEKAPTIEFGILPVQSARSNIQLYQPLRDYLESKTGYRVSLVTAPDYRTYIDRTQRREFQLIVTAPHFARLAQTDAGYIPLMRVKRELVALLVVDRAHPYKSVSQLKGLTVATPDRLAAATFLGYDILGRSGLAPNVDLQVRAFPTFSSAVLALHSGEVAAAITSPTALQQMPEDVRGELVTLAVSDPILPICYLVSPDVPAKMQMQLRKVLLAFGDSATGKKFFVDTGYSGFDPLSAQELQSMDRYVVELKKHL